MRNKAQKIVKIEKRKIGPRTPWEVEVALRFCDLDFPQVGKAGKALLMRPRCDRPRLSAVLHVHVVPRDFPTFKL